MKGKRGYFNKLIAQMDDGGKEAMLYDLQKLDIERWHPREDVPKTLALADQADLSMDEKEAWWNEKLEDARVCVEQEEWCDPIDADAVLENFRNFCDSIGRPRAKCSKSELGKWLRRVLPGKFLKDSRPRVTVTVYNRRKQYEETKSVQKLHWAFPGLERCRKVWDPRRVWVVKEGFKQTEIETESNDVPI